MMSRAWCRGASRANAWLHRTHGVELINFADELPTGSRKSLAKPRTVQRAVSTTSNSI